MPGGLERLAQAADVHVHRALLDEDVVAPHLVEELRARIDAPGMRHEEVQQAELGGRELDALVARRVTRVRGRVEAQAFDLDHVARELRRAPAQHRLDARGELLRRERLGEVVVGAGLEAGDLVLLHRARGEHQDRQVARALVGAQAPREGEARFPRQHPVEDQHVGQRGADRGFGLLGARGAQHAVAAVLEVDRDQLLDLRLVLDDEHGRAHVAAQRLDARRIGVAHVGALDDVDHVLGHVLRVVADALDGLRHPDDLERGGDGARVFHHVGDELAQDRPELAVDRRVVADHVGRRVDVEAREGVERAAQHARARLRRRGARRRMRGSGCRPPRSWMLLRHARDLLRLVADALEVGDGLGDGEDQAQVVRRRLALDDDLAAVAVERDLHAVHLVVGGDHVVDQRAVAARSSASSARRICDSTSPPISSTRERIASSSASNCLERCSFTPTGHALWQRLSDTVTASDDRYVTCGHETATWRQ